MKTHHPFVSRRKFIRTTSAFLALPWFEAFAAPGESAPPKRMVCVCSSFGLYGPSFFPTETGPDYKPSEYLEILGPDLRKHFTVFSGISHPEIGGDHASEACFLTSAKGPKSGNFRNSVSLDFLAAKHTNNATRFPFLSLSTQDGGKLTYTSTGAAVPSLYQPSDIFKRMFLAGNKDQVEKEIARLKEGQSVLDHMAENFASLKNRISSRDQTQLNDYTDAVREMEKQLVANEAWVNQPKPTTDQKPPTDNLDRSDTIGRLRVMLDLTKLALQTDSTRVVSLFIRGMDLRPPIPGVTEDHHGLSHHGRNPAKISQLKIIESREMEVYRDFLTSLRDTKDASSTLLDSTQVLIGSNLGDASSHATNNLPVLLAGGGWKHGNHIGGSWDNNTPLAKLFVSMLQKFGVKTDTFGSGHGTLEGLV